ncbi:MAG: hypothetical protein SFW67_11560 [Myxococcaceae bacterium]|nr:hypothetical protein [Myxococcaceae bacterium]
MSRDGRFEKLERERPTREPDSTPAVAEERFTAAPHAPASPAQATHAPALEAAKAFSPQGAEGTREGLARFETDGANHLSLDTDPLMKLPFRRCAACQRDSGKFERVCLFCGASLDTADARALNLSLLEAQTAARDAEQAAEAERRTAEVKAHVEAEFRKAAELERVDSEQARLGWRLVSVAAAVLCVGLGVWAWSLCATPGLFVVGLALVVVALPKSVLEVLAKPTRRRWL